MAHIVDSETAASIKAAQAKEDSMLRTRAWLEAQEASAVLVDLKGSPLDPERQMGKALRPREFEGRIKKLLWPRQVIFVANPINKTKRCLIVPMGDQELRIPYEAELLPEFSICTVREKWIPDQDFLGGKQKIQRADLKRADKPVSMQTAHDMLKEKGFKATLAELQKRRANPDRIGMRKIFEKSGEALRGWRTVLAKLVVAGLTTPEACERAFGGSERSSWAHHAKSKSEAACW